MSELNIAPHMGNEGILVILRIAFLQDLNPHTLSQTDKQFFPITEEDRRRGACRALGLVDRDAGGGELANVADQLRHDDRVAVRRPKLDAVLYFLEDLCGAEQKPERPIAIL